MCRSGGAPVAARRISKAARVFVCALRSLNGPVFLLACLLLTRGAARTRWWQTSWGSVCPWREGTPTQRLRRHLQSGRATPLLSPLTLSATPGVHRHNWQSMSALAHASAPGGMKARVHHPFRRPFQHPMAIPSQPRQQRRPMQEPKSQPNSNRRKQQARQRTAQWRQESAREENSSLALSSQFAPR